MNKAAVDRLQIETLLRRAIEMQALRLRQWHDAGHTGLIDRPLRPGAFGQRLGAALRG